MLDLTKERDAHVDKRLRSDTTIWLTTVRRDGRPHTVPVWFLWDGATFLIFSQPDNLKIRNLRNNPNVTLALDNTDDGSDVIAVEGKAE
ncbi:MAG TPA: pyridoxamine 5'-phosphate oxidase family protein, partial [Ktedonobacteraceae bacterium]|nr:pyridoxamine 5'-phosphate oxidase family protein [Ktedonobacteraceae bacterium]